VPFWLPQSKVHTLLHCTTLTLPTVDVDILKPDTGYLSVIERPSGPSSANSKTPSPPSTSHSVHTSPPHSAGSSSPVLRPTQYIEPLSEGEDEDADREGELGPAQDEGRRTGLSGDQIQAAVAYREKMLKEAREEEQEVAKAERRRSKEPQAAPETGESAASGSNGKKRPKPQREKSTISRKLGKKNLSIDPLAPSSAFDETLKSKLQGAKAERERNTGGSSAGPSRSPSTNAPRRRYGKRHDEEDEEEEDAEGNGEPASAAYGRSAGIGADRILERNVHAPEGKRISVPVRIEPKVYFANERTFLVCDLIIPTHAINLLHRNG